MIACIARQFLEGSCKTYWSLFGICQDGHQCLCSYKINIWRIMCSLRTPRPICQSTSRPIYRSSISRYVDRYVDQYVGCYVDRCSTDTSVDIAADTRPIFWPLNIGRVSVVYRSIVGGLSVDCLMIKIKSLGCQCQIYNLYALCLDHVRKFSR